MDVGQMWSLFSILFSVVFVIVLVFVVVPEIARDRLTLRMSAVVRALDELDAGALTSVERGAVENLSARVSRLVAVGAPPVSFVIAGAAVFHRQHVRGTYVDGRDPAWRAFENDDFCPHRASIEKLEREMVRETFRATVFGGRFWLLLWPLWLLIHRAFPDTATSAPATASEERVEFAVLEALDLKSRALAPA